MRKLAIFTILLTGGRLYSQSLTVEQVKADIDTVITVLSNVHPTFKESPNKQALLMLKDTVSVPVTSHELFKLIQPLIALDGHTTLQFNGAVFPEAANLIVSAEDLSKVNLSFFAMNGLISMVIFVATILSL